MSCTKIPWHTEDPGKSFGLKFIPNQSYLIRFIPKVISELIRVNPKKVFNLIERKSVENLSDRVNPRIWIRINLNQFFNPNESDVGIIHIDSV